MATRLIQIRTKTSTFGVEVDSNMVVVRAAPIARWMVGFPLKLALKRMRERAVSVRPVDGKRDAEYSEYIPTETPRAESLKR